MKKLFMGTILTISMLGSMSAYANDGMGMSADPGASLDTFSENPVYCVDDLEFKSYINDSDPVLITYKAGTIFDVDSKLLKNGTETGWGAAIVKNQNQGGGECNGFFELDKVKPYGGEENVRVEISEDCQDVIIRVPEMFDEEFIYYSSNIDVLESTGEEIIDGDFVVYLHAADDYTEDATVTFKGYVDGIKYDEIVVTLYGTGCIDFATVTIAPLDFSEIKDEIDYYDEMHSADGMTEKVIVLKDGRRIDMNGYQLIGIADDAVKGHDGRVLSSGYEEE